MAAKENNSPLNFQGPFLTGFVAGMAAGAAAVYFFATPRGKDFVEEIEDLWEEARPELVKQGVVEATDESLGQAVKGFLIQAFASKASQLTGSKKRVRSSKTLFRGV